MGGKREGWACDSWREEERKEEGDTFVDDKHTRSKALSHIILETQYPIM